jgi:hypothetical protein
MASRNSKRWTVYAKRLRAALIVALGGACTWCGTTNDLEVDHILGRTWVARNLSSISRARRYWEEYNTGVPLRVLCSSCNGGYLNNPKCKNPPNVGPTDGGSGGGVQSVSV